MNSHVNKTGIQKKQERDTIEVEQIVQHQEVKTIGEIVFFRLGHVLMRFSHFVSL